MCVIVSKGAGIELPEKDVLQQCFNHNDDGAGLMTLKDDKVLIKKGFMTWDAFEEEHERLVTDRIITADLPVVYHFRIATNGKTMGGNCHPFPVSKSLRALRETDMLTEAGIAHNGILSTYGEGRTGEWSDTMDFIRKEIATRPSIKQIVLSGFENDDDLDVLDDKLGYGNKMAILTPDSLVRFGASSWKEDKGIHFSNLNHKRSKRAGCGTASVNYSGYTKGTYVLTREEKVKEHFREFLDSFWTEYTNSKGLCDFDKAFAKAWGEFISKADTDTFFELYDVLRSYRYGEYLS